MQRPNTLAFKNKDFTNRNNQENKILRNLLKSVLGDVKNYFKFTG